MKKRRSLSDRIGSFLNQEIGEIAKSVLSVAIPAMAGAVGIGVRYAYEVGYCHHFGIPKEFVVFDTVSILSAALVLGLGFAMFFWALKIVLADILRSVAIGARINIGYHLFFAMFLAAPYLISGKYRGEVFLILIWTVIIGGGLSAIWRRRSEFDNGVGLLMFTAFAGGTALISNLFIKSGQWWASVALILGPLLAAILIVVVELRHPIEGEVIQRNESEPENLPMDKVIFTFLLCFVGWPLFCAYSYGIANAAETTRFLISDVQPNYALATTYGDTLFFCEFATDSDGEKLLTGRLRMSNRDDVSGTVFEWTEAGPLSKRSP